MAESEREMKIWKFQIIELEQTYTLICTKLHIYDTMPLEIEETYISENLQRWNYKSTKGW